MNRGINLLKGLLGMVALAALVLAFNWFFSDARRTPSAGQMPSPTGERPPPVSTHPESVSSPPTSTPAITQPASSPTPTAPGPAPAGILYARQERERAPTLW